MSEIQVLLKELELFELAEEWRQAVEGAKVLKFKIIEGKPDDDEGVRSV